MLLVTFIVLGCVGIFLWKAYNQKIEDSVSQIYDAAAKEENILKTKVKDEIEDPMVKAVEDYLSKH